MRHEGRLCLPANTSHVVVDPLEDFAFHENGKAGVFTECYGVKDTIPIREALGEIQTMLIAWAARSMQTKLILCKSQYDFNQFDVPGLEELCTTDKGRNSLVREQAFDAVVTKRDNSLFSVPELNIDDLLGDGEYAGVEGVTLTSCVVKTIIDLRKRQRQQMLVLPLNAIGWRTQQNQKAQEIIDEYSDESVEDVLVIDKWQQIEHAKS